MSTVGNGRIRAATEADAERLVHLWAELFPGEPDDSGLAWEQHARQWFLRVADASDEACFPVVDLDGQVVATAIGTLELGVPNPDAPRGRAVRLANVITLPQHRGQGVRNAARVRGCRVGEVHSR